MCLTIVSIKLRLYINVSIPLIFGEQTAQLPMILSFYCVLSVQFSLVVRCHGTLFPVKMLIQGDEQFAEILSGTAG